MTDAQTMIRTALADGREVDVPESVREMFRGIDAEGHLVICHPDMPTAEDGGEYLYGLTSCCYASATGTEHGIACRSCYADCSRSLGGPATVAVAAISVGSRVSYEDMANPLREGVIVGSVVFGEGSLVESKQWLVRWDEEGGSCCDEHEAGACPEDCESAFDTSVTETMLARAAERQAEARASRAGRRGGWAVEVPRV